MNFSFDTFPVTISGLPFLFVKFRILVSVYKLKGSQNDVVRKLLRRIQNIRIMCNES